MATINGQAGTNLSSELAKYLSANQGNLTSEQLTAIINKYLSGGDKLESSGGAINSGIYKRFGEYDQVTGKVEIVTTGLWSGDRGILTNINTSGAQPINQDYYTNVFESGSDEVQFAVSYGHINGLGSISLAHSGDATYPTKATYVQYRSILLEQDQTHFQFEGSNGLEDSDDIYIINVQRARYRETMDPGNISLTLKVGSVSVTLIDDSGKKFSDKAGKAGRIFNMVEGVLNLGTENQSTIKNKYSKGGHGWGTFYPDQGIIVLNPIALTDKLGSTITPSKTTSSNAKNHLKLFNAIRDGKAFDARRTENVSTAHYFVRATNREFNYSNNPTFVTGSDGTFTESSFEKDPKTYITTIGLYSDENEMLAVAKASQPIPKSFNQEVLIKVKLSF